MKKIIITIFVILISIFYFLANMASILSWLGIQPNKIQDLTNILDTEEIYVSLKEKLLNFIEIDYIYYYIFFGIVTIIVLYFLKKNKVISSNYCKRLKLFVFIKIIYPKKAFHIIKSLHDLEHQMIKKRNLFGDLKDKSSNIKSLRQNAINDILVEYKKIFDLVSSDVSINFKKFKSKQKHLETIARIPSRYESNKYFEDNTYKRSNEEIFTVQKVKNTKISELQGTNNLKVNSAYNKVMYESEKFWICNNLKKATIKGKYKSTSENYEKYYNSIAVFLVFGKKSNEPNTKVYGILTFDSKKTHAFEHNIIKELGGYLSHKLYYFLDRLNTECLILTNKKINKINNRATKSNRRKNKKK